MLSLKADDACSINPCKNNGICIEQPGLYGFTCKCDKDWTGTICDKPTSVLNNQSNSPGGSINIGQNSNNSNSINSNNLQPTNRGGLIIENKQSNYGVNSPCFTNPCLNGGLCTPNHFKSQSAFVCKCNGSYFGDKCQFFGKRKNFLISSVIPFLLVISFIGLFIYCCCYKKRLAQNANTMNLNDNRVNQGFVGQIMSFPTTIFQSRQPKPTAQYTAAPFRQPYPVNNVIIQQDPEIAFRVNTNNPPPPAYSSLYTSEQKPLNS